MFRKSQQDERFRAAAAVWRSRTATAEISRLRRLQANGATVGSIRLVSTLTVLERAAGGPHLPDKSAMHAIYTRLRGLDDGLPPIERANLPGSIYGRRLDR